MRFLLVVAIVACGLAIWLFAPRLTALQRGVQQRTFAQQLGDNEELKRAAAAGQLHEDAARRGLRQAILRASSHVMSSPCDMRLRKALRDAQEAYRLKAVASVETYTLKDGTVIDSAGYFNGPVTAAARDAENTSCGG